jgi:hypothetical protein
MGRWSGRVDGNYSFGDGGRSVTLRPRRSLSAGELVLVIVSHDVMGEDGSPLRRFGHSFQFWTRIRPGRLAFEERGTLTTRSSPGAYGVDHDDDVYAIGLWGDLPYSPTQVAVSIPNLIADMNENARAFTVHDGDLNAGSNGPCNDGLYEGDA